MWIPVAGIVLALCIYDMTGGDAETPEAEGPRSNGPEQGAEDASAGGPYDSLDL